MSDWVVCGSSLGKPMVRLFCFPHAGSGASAYLRWVADLPQGIALCAIQPPGRERRYREKPLTDLQQIVETIAEEIRPLLSSPFVFFGHSMGALVAFEVARTLRRRGLPPPSLLFVSGRRPPGEPHDVGPLHRMPDAEFLQVIGERYGGLPTVIAQDPELLALFLPTLRADVLAHETYEYRKEEVLDVPVIGLGGRDDLTVEPARIAGWAEETECFMELMVFPGGHFFIQTEQESVVSFLGKRTIEHLGLSQQPDGSGDSAASGGYKSVSAVSDEG